jgi:Bifunctional DNA primase/polymerase, N-terminal
VGNLPNNTALEYAEKYGWPVFPCNWRPGTKFKRPLVDDWDEVATVDPEQIERWWTRWPRALIGMPTGRPNTFVVLDVDVKDPRAYGLDTLDELGFAILPPTRMVHTSSGGLHLHFDQGEHKIHNTQGQRGRGIGPGLDWRGEGGYAILPSEGSGYSWDPHYGIDAPLAAAPPELLPHEPKRESVNKPVEAADGLSPYARAALNSACRNITQAPNGEQEATLNSESLAIGSLAASGAIPETFALRALMWAGSQLRDYDQKRPWGKAEIEDKIKRAFGDGLRRPREVRRHG